ncbi:hypothetical protein B0H67DRAFT_321557 [Lasiosphaeris hirsuta]|uniref:Steroid 5-alpha reductase C-terminal domain-containing protein n=1 Tax=Lasiosphaeris hirsuta TaxID=260670 RepID=A0AA40A299_9PEZI|nr:hypothetical protein B0H67DRAFT_321557 [Lasiosphaeris hirsuta]
MAFLQSLLHITDFGGPFLSNLGPAVLAAYAVQLGFGIPGVVAHSDLFYDFSGGWTFLLTLSSSLVLPALRRGAAVSLTARAVLDSWNWRQLAMTAGVALYAVRCTFSTFLLQHRYGWLLIFGVCKVSGYLFRRVLKNGHDSRFDKIKHQPRRFLIFWLVQAVWVLLCCMPVLAVNSIHPAAFKAGMGVPDVLPTDVLGLGLWAFGWTIEIVADYQKSVWNAEKQNKIHDEQFITRGIWARSRFPNYFGDITLWIGMAIAAAGVLQQGPIQASLGWNGTTGLLKAVLLPAAAPAFVAWALLRATGVPLSQAKYDKLYGDRKDYQEWRNKTPLLVPRVF